MAAANKIKHYKDELGPTGPFAPGKGRFVPFAVSSGGLLAPDALGLLKHWAHCRVGEPATAGTSASSAASRPYLLNSLRLTSTVLQRPVERLPHPPRCRGAQRDACGGTWAGAN